MTRYDDEYGELRDEPDWISTGELLALAGGSVICWGAVVALGFLVWWAL